MQTCSLHKNLSDISWGYGATPHTSMVALASGAFSLPTIVLARLVLKERTGRLRAAASVVIVAAIVLLNRGELRHW
jgi:drug/metabolite transporter (DMT)-like permease